MPKPMKQNGFLPSVPRLFTRQEEDAYRLLHFRDADAWDGPLTTAFAYPAQWTVEAAALLANEAAYAARPIRVKAVEENTVPSWLWRHSAVSGATEPEQKTQQIFDRVAGAAVYAGWKKHLFASEKDARNFFDEIRYALALRSIAIEPRFLARMGLDWAYGLTSEISEVTPVSHAQTLEITNPMIDAIVSGSTNKNLRNQWQRMLQNPQQARASLRFADTSHEWGHSTAESIPVMIDLLALRHNDGSVNIESLRHAVKLTVTLLDLLDLSATHHLALGFSNLAPLLMALALPYDSEAAHMTAASLTAILTAEATITSAQLSALRGVSASFTAERETVLRTLRNHRRAAYGDHNDYEKISVLPQALSLTAGLDLALVAAAQHLWDEALDLARLYGLRCTHMTSFVTSPQLALFMESSTQGIQALPSLTLTRPSDEGDIFTQSPQPCLGEAMTRLGYTPHQSKAILAQATGYRSLDKAPVINHAALRDRGFDKAALDRLENYLPYVNTVRLAFTPWILGEAFCRETLKLSAKQMDKPTFDLLHSLGFTPADIDAADRYYYGQGSVKGARDLRNEHAAIFVCQKDVSPEASIRMAAAVQSFVSDDVDLSLELSGTMSIQKAEALVLTAWRQGIKTLALSYHQEASRTAQDDVVKTAAKTRRKLTSSLHTQQPRLPSPSPKAKASRRMVGMGSPRGKNTGFTRSKSR